MWGGQFGPKPASRPVKLARTAASSGDQDKAVQRNDGAPVETVGGAVENNAELVELVADRRDPEG